MKIAHGAKTTVMTPCTLASSYRIPLFSKESSLVLIKASAKDFLTTNTTNIPTSMSGNNETGLSVEASPTTQRSSQAEDSNTINPHEESSSSTSDESSDELEEERDPAAVQLNTEATGSEHRAVYSRIRRLVHSGSFEFITKCRHGDSESLTDKVIHDLRKWHETHHDRYPPISTIVAVLYGRAAQSSVYYDEEGDKLKISGFSVDVSNQDPDVHWYKMHYAIRLLYLPGQPGVPVTFSPSIPEYPGRLSWGFTWNTEKHSFDPKPFAVRMYASASADVRIEVDDLFKPYYFKLAEGKYWIREDLEMKTLGKIYKGKKAESNRGAGGLSKSNLPFETYSEFSEPDSDSWRAAKRLKMEDLENSLVLRESSPSDMKAMPKLLASARVKLVSEESDRERVFFLDECNAKTLFQKAREFFGIKDTSKEIFLICKVPGIKSRRYIGEDCLDEFDILCHDVRKLTISDHEVVEVLVKLGASAA